MLVDKAKLTPTQSVFVGYWRSFLCAFRCLLVISADQLVCLFNNSFTSDYHVRLVAGAEEPLYTPASNGNMAQIHFRHDYVASALHEISHWCLAGTERLQLEDYGYWYEPDTRTEAQQKHFESVEVKPQAIEYALHLSVQRPFRVSADNLALIDYDASEFEAKVAKQLARYLVDGLPTRAAIFCRNLLAHARVTDDLYECLKKRYEDCSR